MKLFVLILSTIPLLFINETAFAQTKKETLKWINTQGEENLKDITGNPTIHWELDNYGALKITNYQPESEGDRKIVKRYTYLNLYELDSKRSLAEKHPKNLILRCQTEKKDCIKVRMYSSVSDSETIASPLYSLSLANTYDLDKCKKLYKYLIRAIKLFQGNSSKN